MKTYGHISITSEGWVIHSISPHVAIKLKAIFEGIRKTDTPPILLPDSPAMAHDFEWFLSRYPMEIDTRSSQYMKARVAEYKDTQKQMEQVFLPDYTPIKRTFTYGAPRNYQVLAADLYDKRNRLLVGDDVGLGKTVIAITSFTNPENLPALVVMQAHLPTQWKDQIEKFLKLKIHIIKKRKPYSLPSADVYLCSYSKLLGWIDFFQEGFFKSVVFDEIQELRRSESLKYAAASNISRNVKRALGLSATPIYNYGSEIFNIMNILDRGCLGKKSDFDREWATGYKGRVVDPKALGSYLRDSHLFLRRTKKDVDRELPSINKIVHTVDHDLSAEKKIEDIARSLAIRVTSGSFVDRGQAARELDMMVRHATGVGKAKFVAEYVKIFLENNEPVLLAGWHRDVYDIWLEEFKDYNPLMYTGSESAKQKENAKKAFMNGESNLMIISLRSGIGLDGLQHRCSTIVYGELDWSPAVHEQLGGRLDRDGQKNRVTAVFLVSNGGSDPILVNLLGLKASQAKEIVDPFDKGAAQAYSDGSRIQLLANLYLNKQKKQQEFDL